MRCVAYMALLDCTTCGTNLASGETFFARAAQNEEEETVALCVTCHAEYGEAVFCGGVSCLADLCASELGS
eukprot:SAG31_NODE_42_length_31262_cov_46.416231_3_plen_71_part_00